MSTALSSCISRNGFSHTISQYGCAQWGIFLNLVCRNIPTVVILVAVSLSHAQFVRGNAETQPMVGERPLRNFNHRGLFSHPGGTWDRKQVPGVGEWIMNNASIPVAEYK